MKTSSNLIFFGNERLSSGFSPTGAPTLEALIKEGYTINAVVANYHDAISRKARSLEVESVAKAHNIPLLTPDKLTDIRDKLAVFQAPAAVLVAYGKIIPQNIIDLFPKGIINIHPSLLPQYRGSTPIEQAILDGAARTGVSLMKIVRTMDAGPIYAQSTINLKGNESKQELTNTLLHLGGKLLITQLPAILSGRLTPTPQDESKVSYTPQLNKSDATIDWQLPAIIIERQIRAYALWPKSHTQLLGQPVIITRARVASNLQDGGAIQVCGEGFLEILELIAPSGKRMSGEAFMRGYRRP